MKMIDKDYVPPDMEEMEKFPDGKHVATGFTWFTLDDNTKKPVLVAQKNHKLVARLRFHLPDGTQGPPMSVELGEVSLLVRAFGGDINQLPAVPEENQPGLVSNYLEMAELIEKTKTPSIISKDGWVNSPGVHGMGVPEGLYYFYLKELGPVDKVTGVLTPKDGQYGKFFFATFVIESGEGGGKTEFKKATFQDIVSYSVTVSDDGKPDWEKTTTTQQYSAAAVRLTTLMRLTAPLLFVDEFSPPDPYNLLPWWSQAALAEHQLLGGTMVKNEKGEVKLMWSTLKPGVISSGSYVTPAPVPAVLPPVSTVEAVADIVEEKGNENANDADERARAILLQAMDYLAGEVTVGPRGGLLDAGKDIARTYFAPLKRDNKIKNGSFVKLDYDDVLAIFETFPEDDNITKLKAEMTFAGVGFEAPVSTGDDEWGDNPYL